MDFKPISLFLAILLAAVSLAMLLVAVSAQTPSTAPAVLVAPAENKPLGRQVEFIGRVEAIEKVDLRARVQAFLTARHFEAGDRVEKGQLLFELEREPFEAALAQRKAQLAAAEATLKNAEAQLARYRSLEGKEVASVAELDTRIAAEARARASVLEAKAAVQDAEISLSYTRITAPISGRIGRASLTVGNLVGPETGVLATLVRSDKIYVLFSVTQAELLEARRTETGAPLTVRARLADGSFLDAAGTIDFIDVQADARTDGQLLRAVFDNPGDALTDGQTVRVVIERASPAMVTAIPMSAVALDQGGHYVYIVDDANKVERRSVTLGVKRDGLVAVTDGLSAGDRVIVQGQQKVRPGAQVDPQPLSGPASGARAALQ